jgi:hypothetical protein
MSYSKSALDDRAYRDAMQGPMEDLAVALFTLDESKGPAGSAHWLDAQIVEHAAKKIEVLKAMIIATGFSEKLLQTIMDS